MGEELQMGNKVVVYAGLTTIVSLLVVIIILIYMLVETVRENRADILGEFGDPEILNRAPGHQGPAVHLGNVITYRGLRCANRSTVIEQITFYEPTMGRSVPGDRIVTDVVKGCVTASSDIKMPEGITTGRWRLSGIVRARNGGEVRYWTSEEFLVVP